MILPGPDVPVVRVTPNVITLPELFRERCKRSAKQGAMYEKVSSTWEKLTWDDFYTRARQAALGLRKLGVVRGDRVAILGPTQPTWPVLDMACQLLGAVSFGIYPKQTISQIAYQLLHSEAKVICVSGSDELSNVLAAAGDAKDLVAIIPWEAELATGQDRVVSPTSLSGEALTEAEVTASLGAIKADHSNS